MNQVIVVETEDWNSVQGVMTLVEDGQVLRSFPAVMGYSGTTAADEKREGDGKSPAGVFALGAVYGKKTPIPQLKMPFHPILPSHEAVDDPKSHFYNQIVNRNQITHPDWDSAEILYDIPLYDYLITIHHNWPNPIPYRGSAIFMHEWRSSDEGTAGCTAMSSESLFDIIKWLDPDKYPKLIQGPRFFIKNLVEFKCW